MAMERWYVIPRIGASGSDPMERVSSREFENEIEARDFAKDMARGGRTMILAKSISEFSIPVIEEVVA